MHQDLLNREDLPPDRRTLASFELAQDFQAGLLDHAEEVLSKLDGSAFEPIDRHLISHLRSGKGLGEGDCRDAAHRSARQAPISRRSRNTIASSLTRRCCARTSPRRRRKSITRWQRIGVACAPTCSRRHGVAAAAIPRGDRCLAAHRVAGSGLPGTRRGSLRGCVSPRERRGGRHPRAAQLPEPVPLARYPQRLFYQVPSRKATKRRTLSRTSCAQSDAGRARPPDRSAAACAHRRSDATIWS